MPTSPRDLPKAVVAQEFPELETPPEVERFWLQRRQFSGQQAVGVRMHLAHQVFGRLDANRQPFKAQLGPFSKLAHIYLQQSCNLELLFPGNAEGWPDPAMHFTVVDGKVTTVNAFPPVLTR